MTSTRPAPKPENLLRRPAHPDISEALVHDLVFAFYDRIRADATLGPIFDGVIGDRWDEHLAKMCDFWSSVMLASGRYEGRPLAAHLRLKGVGPEHFEIWLRLFRQTAGERSEEHTSEFQSLMRISYAVFCLKKKTHKQAT